MVPISRVLSVTETSIIFITPMPPTKSEIPGMKDTATVDNKSIAIDRIESIVNEESGWFNCVNIDGFVMNIDTLFKN